MTSAQGLSSALLRIISERIGWETSTEGFLHLDELAQGVKVLSNLFTKNRRALDGRYFADPRLLRAYLAYFLPVNIAKIISILKELPTDEVSLPESPLRLLDVGSGPGTGTLAVLDWMQQCQGQIQTLDATLVDGVESSLEEARLLWDSYCRMEKVTSAHLHCHRWDLERTASMKLFGQARPFHVIIVANTLNEVYRQSNHSLERQVQLVQTLLGCLHPQGSLLLVEPALKHTSRELHALRDRLLALNACTIYSPCLHEQPCPALFKQDDWCHEERPWIAPPWVSTLDRAVGFIKDSLKFSYLVLRKDGRTIVPRTQDVFRVVSELRTMKGDSRAWICNHTGRVEVGRLDRDETESNAAIRTWHRGAIVQVADIKRKTPISIGRIKGNSRADIVRSV